MFASDGELAHDQGVVAEVNEFLPWLVCFAGSLFFFYEFIQMNMFNAINTALMQDFGLNSGQLGGLSATYFLANVTFLLPAGMILDRFSTRKIMLVSLSICVGGTYLFAMAKSVPLLAMCRFLTGIGSAFCFLSNVRLATRWFPPQRIALVTGLIVTMAMAGGFVAQKPLTQLVVAFGWRHALTLDASLGLVIIAMIWVFVRDYPPHKKAKATKDRKALHRLGFWKATEMAFLNYRNWLCGIYTCVLNLPLFILGGFMGTMFLMTVHNISHTEAASITGMLFLGTIVGAPFVGWLSDRIELRKPPMMVGAMVSTLVMLVIMLVTGMPVPALKALFFLLGFVTSSQVISYPVVSESNSPLLTATCVSCVSLTCIGGGALFEPVFGWLVDWHWTGKMAGNLPAYTVGDFQFAMWIFPIGFLIGLAVTYFIRETHCKNEIG